MRHVLLGGTKLGSLGTLFLKVAEFPVLALKLFERPQLIPNPFPDLDGFKKSGHIPSEVTQDKGYLLLSVYDPRREQAIVQLVRIRDQKLIYEWVPDIVKLANADKVESSYKSPIVASHYRLFHPFLMEDGGLILKDYSPVYKIDHCSRIEWTVNGVYHHSTERDADGSFWIPSILDPSPYEGTPLAHSDDAIEKISTDGKVLFKKSVTEIFKDNDLFWMLGVGYTEDPLHLNDIQPALYDSEYWKRGDVLVSLKNRSVVFLYRPETGKIIWYRMGPWLNQHDADFVGDSQIMVFGNDIIDVPVGPSTFVNGHSDIYLFDFKTGKINKPYSKAMKDLNVRTPTEGLSEMLKNGDVFVEETNRARILRIGPGRVKWEYVSVVDSDNIAMLTWSRYLYESQVLPLLPKLNTDSCPN